MSFVAGNVEKLSGLDGLVCDLDGVMYRGADPIEGSPQAIERLGRLGVHVVFCTNNANPTIDRYLDKLASMGVPVGREDLVTSPVVTAEVLSDEGAAGRSAIVVGGEGLREALRSIDVVVDDDPSSRTADYVVVGLDPDFTYETLKRASFAVQNGAELIAANADASFPAPDGLWPGAGFLVSAVEVASGGRARVMGKPHEPMIARGEEAPRRSDTDRHRRGPAEHRPRGRPCYGLDDDPRSFGRDLSGRDRRGRTHSRHRARPTIRSARAVGRDESVTPLGLPHRPPRVRTPSENQDQDRAENEAPCMSLPRDSRLLSQELN